MSVQGALERCAASLAGDVLHVAAVVIIDMNGQPELWVASREGKSRRIRDVKLGMSKDEDTVAAPFSWADLKLAADYLEILMTRVQYFREQPDDGHTNTITALQERAERQMSMELHRDAEVRRIEREQPWKCSCGNRSVSKRGIKQHIKRTRAHWRSHEIVERPDQ